MYLIYIIITFVSHLVNINLNDNDVIQKKMAGRESNKRKADIDKRIRSIRMEIENKKKKTILWEARAKLFCQKLINVINNCSRKSLLLF